MKPSANLVCPQFIVAKSLIFPKPDATGVPTSVGIAVISGVDSNGSVTLQPIAGKAVVSRLQAPVPSPLPSPDGPAISSSFTAFRIPILRPQTAYVVFAQENAANGSPKHCPNSIPLELGLFTTGL